MPRLSKIESARRRVDRVRRAHGFAVTCPFSRHVQSMADGLSDKGYPMFEEEPEHCAESLYVVIEELWKLRAARLSPPQTRRARR